MIEVDSAEKQTSRRKKKPASVAILEAPKSRETVRFARNLGASETGEYECDMLDRSLDELRSFDIGRTSSGKSRRKRDLSVTIDDSDNYGMGPPAKKRSSSSSSSSSLSSSAPPPEDTPRYVIYYLTIACNFIGALTPRILSILQTLPSFTGKGALGRRQSRQPALHWTACEHRAFSCYCYVWRNASPAGTHKHI